MTRWWWLIGLLSGCVQLAPAPTAVDPRYALWEARQALLQLRQQFVLSGRIAVQREAEGGQAKLHWQQAGSQFALRLIAPLAQGTFLLSGDDQAVSLVAPNGDSFQAPDLDTLMTTHLKWALPVAGARYWVLGLPVPGHKVTQLSLDEQGRLRDLAQDGWRISVLEYQTVAGLDLPRKLFLLGDTLKLTLVITEWPTPPQ
jgi:outer membrane lipoprotein LolB